MPHADEKPATFNGVPVTFIESIPDETWNAINASRVKVGGERFLVANDGVVWIKNMNADDLARMTNPPKEPK